MPLGDIEAAARALTTSPHDLQAGRDVGRHDPVYPRPPLRPAIAMVVSRIFRTFDQATASVCVTCD